MNSWYPLTSSISALRISTLHGCPRDTADGIHNPVPKLVEFESIRGFSHSNHYVQRRHLWQELDSRNLAKSALQSVAVDGGPRVPRHNDPNSHMRLRGSARPDGKVPGPDELPLLQHAPQLCVARNAVRPRESPARTILRRTWTGALPSAVSVPSSVDGSAHPDPSVLTFWSGIRACECAACFAADMLACP